MKPHDRREKDTTTEVWLTPPSLIRALGHFHLDPCSAPAPRPWDTADVHYDITQGQDGLRLPWAGRVWCNPPFATSKAWVQRMIEHRSGILLMPASLETAEPSTITARWMLDVWPSAQAVLLVSPRVSFLKPDGSKAKNGSTKQSALLAFCGDDAHILKECAIAGVYTDQWTVKPLGKGMWPNV